MYNTIESFIKHHGWTKTARIDYLMNHIVEGKSKDEIKKVEAGLYFLRLREIDNEIKLENEINSEAEKKVEIFNDQLKEIQDQIDIDTEKLSPVREKNIEILFQTTIKKIFFQFFFSTNNLKITCKTFIKFRFNGVIPF